MGMGEPFHNYDQVMTALEILTDEYGFNFSQRRVTVSTSGLVPQIRRFGQERVKANLAISLNGSSDTVRGRLMPVNKRYNLAQLVQVCQEFPLEARKRITFEYILLKGITDSIDDAKALIRLLHGVKFKINRFPSMLHQTVSTNALIGSRFSAFNVTCWIGVWSQPYVSPRDRISRGVRPTTQ